MINKDLEISKDPLWKIPEPIIERMRVNAEDREYHHFLLCGLYSMVAILFLLLFGFAALSREDTGFAIVIFGFAAATLLVYLTAWVTRRHGGTKHLLTILMGLLCLYLYYTGGTDNTGLYYYFVFPLVAMFLQGLPFGVVSVAMLLVMTGALELGALGFDTARYPDTLVVRVAAIYVILAMLTYLFEYFRMKAERELLLIASDLQQLTFGDMGTGLANRRLMERLLLAEHKRRARYQTNCCLMFIAPDNLQAQVQKFGAAYERQVKHTLAVLLQRHLRAQDVPGIWDDGPFLVLLPDTTLSGAETLARRLLSEVTHVHFKLQGQTLAYTISIGISSLQETDPVDTLCLAADNLAQAQREGGDRVVLA